MIRITLGICIFFTLALFSYAQAQSDTFNVRMNIVGTDTTPPTTPGPLTATPIASSQINLSWGASTDDTVLGGYQVFRDAVHIATTTLTTYSDTGLSASTTYGYHVIAFDTSNNFSSSSNSVSTTTFPITPTSTPTTTDSEGGAHTSVTLQYFEITPDVYSATLSWKTNRFAQYELRWGRTTSYELGFVTNEVYKREHSTVITDLQSGTTYEYELVAYNKDGFRTVLSRGQFKTLDIPDAIAPSNVWNLRAVAIGNDVQLRWNNPQDGDLSHVRMVRSHLFYPTDPYDGFIAYQGKGTEFLDKNALGTHNVQYYTIFSYDYKGNVSSGATVAVFVDDVPSFEESTSTESFTLSFDDVELVQNNTQVPHSEIDARFPTTLRIAYEKLPEHLKTIIVTMGHPEDASSSFSFLLRINKDKSYYEATLAPLPAGAYDTVLTVFDYKTHRIKQVEGVLTVRGTHAETGLLPVLFTGDSSTTVWLWLLLVLLLLLLLYLFVRSYRSKHLLGMGASVGGALLIILTLVSLPLLRPTQEVGGFQAASLLDIPFISEFAGVWLLLFLCMFGMIALLSLRKKK